MINNNYCRFVLTSLLLIQILFSQNLSTYKDFVDYWTQLDSICNINPPECSEENSKLGLFMKSFNFWVTRLSNSNNIETYLNNFNLSYNYFYHTNTIQSNTTTWNEIGPLMPPAANGLGSFARGLGPIVRIEYSKINPNKMIVCSMGGGIFLSNDAGNTWQSTGTDINLPRSGCKGAVFDETNDNIWYAISAVEPNPFNWYNNEIFATGGVFRTMDNGINWQKIADENTFNVPNSCFTGGVTSLYDIKWNNGKLYIASSCGLFICNNPTVTNPIWNVTLPGELIYDIEIHPTNPNIIYVTSGTYPSNCDRNNLTWQIKKSTDGGITWSVLFFNFSTQVDHLNIEVTPAQPNYLYVLIDYHDISDQDCVNNDELYIYDISSNTFNFIVGGLAVYMGHGHAFGVSPTNVNEVFIGKCVHVSKIDILSQTVTDFVCCSHIDIEDIVINSNGIYAATHGGIYRSTDGGNSFFDSSNGLNVTQVTKFDAYDNYILAGLYHDGTIRSDGNSWITVTDGDGQRALIDKQNPQFMWGSTQFGLWYYSNDYGYTFGTRNCYPFSCSTIWSTEGTYNSTASVLFRIIGAFNTSDVIRSFDKGLNNQQISNFSSSYAGAGSYLVWKVYSHPTNPNYLYAHIVLCPTGNCGVSTQHELWRTANALDPNPANVQWEWLPLPVNNHWFSKIDFDENNPNIVYLVSSSDVSWANVPIGHQMLFKVDYTNPNLMFPGGSCPSGVCQDLTFNLPNTGVGDNAFVLEKGSNGGMYIGTDIGVFYTNNTLLSNDPQPWKLHGNNLPHVPINGLEINYIANKIRAGLYGRGVWEADLYCPPDYDININSSNFTQYNAQFNEAEHDIYLTSNGSSYTLNDFTARAGNEIVMAPTGNDEIIISGTGNGSHLFIHPCNHPGNSFRKTKDHSKNIADNNHTSLNPSLLSNKNTDNPLVNENISIYPNPADEHFHININHHLLKTEDNIKVKIFNSMGIILQSHTYTNKDNIVITEHLPNGLYFVQVQTEQGVFTEKLVVRH